MSADRVHRGFEFSCLAACEGPGVHMTEPETSKLRFTAPRACWHCGRHRRASSDAASAARPGKRRGAPALHQEPRHRSPTRTRTR